MFMQLVSDQFTEAQISESEYMQFKGALSYSWRGGPLFTSCKKLDLQYDAWADREAAIMNQNCTVFQSVPQFHFSTN